MGGPSLRSGMTTRVKQWYFSNHARAVDERFHFRSSADFAQCAPRTQMPRVTWAQFQGRSFNRRRRRSENRLGVRPRGDQRRHETAAENAGPQVSQRHRRTGESHDRKYGTMVLEEIASSMS